MMFPKTGFGLCSTLGCDCGTTISAAGSHFMRAAQEQSQHLKADRTEVTAEKLSQPRPNHAWDQPMESPMDFSVTGASKFPEFLKPVE